MVNFPLFLISFAIYNMIVFLTPGVSWSDPLFTVPLYSGADWAVSFGDALIALSLLFLFIGMFRIARGLTRPLMDQLLAAIVVAGALAQFVLVREAATSIFAILCLLAIIDLVGNGVASAYARRAAAAAVAEPSSAAVTESAADRVEAEIPQPSEDTQQQPGDGPLERREPTIEPRPVAGVDAPAGASTGNVESTGQELGEQGGRRAEP